VTALPVGNADNRLRHCSRCDSWKPVDDFPYAVIAGSVVASTAGSITVKTGAHTSNALGSGEYAIATPASYSHTTT